MPTLMAALPRDIDRRAELLDAVASVIPTQSPHAVAVLELRSFLDAHLVAQSQFEFTESEASGRGSGRLGDNPIERGSGRLGDQPLERGGRK